MAAETKAFASCHACGKGVAVKINVSGKAYYRCDHCGFGGQHHWQRSSDAYVASIAPAAPEKPEKSERAAAPAAAPVAAPAAPAKPRHAGTLLG